MFDPFPSTYLRLHTDFAPAACRQAVDEALKRRVYEGYPRTLGDRLKAGLSGFTAPGWEPVQGRATATGFSASRMPAGALTPEARGRFVPDPQGTTVLVRVGATVYARCYFWAVVGLWLVLSIAGPLLQASPRSLSDLIRGSLGGAFVMGIVFLPLVGVTYWKIRALIRSDTPFLLIFVREAFGDARH